MKAAGKDGMWKKVFDLLPKKQKVRFVFILVILGVSAVLSQLTPLAIGYLTDYVLAERDATFQKVIPILLGILLAVSYTHLTLPTTPSV